MQFRVVLLGVPDEHFECLVGVEVIALHQDALCLTDHFACIDGLPEILFLAGGGDRYCRVSGDDVGDSLVLDVELVRCRAVEVEGAEDFLAGV